MSQLFTATDVTATNGNKFIQVNTGDDVSLISPNSWIQIGNGRIQEVKTVNTSATPQTIELFDNWNGASGSGQSAISAPTAAEIKAAAEEIRQLRVTYEGIAGDVNVSAAANSIAKRDSNGRLKASAPVASDDVVTKAYFQSDAALNSAGIFHSGNSVNPLEYGIGGVNKLPDTSSLQGGYENGFYYIANATSSPSANAANWYLRVENVLNNPDFRKYTASPVNLIYGSAAEYTCIQSNGTFTNWERNFTEGNTNFNEFGGISNNDTIGVGGSASSSLAIFYLPINSKVKPTSISVTGTFKIRLPFNGNDLATNVTPSINLDASSNKYVALVVSGVSGLPTAGTLLELRTESTSSKITVNF